MSNQEETIVPKSSVGIDLGALLDIVLHMTLGAYVSGFVGGTKMTLESLTSGTSLGAWQSGKPAPIESRMILDLTNYVREQNWQKIIPAIDDVILQLERSKLESGRLSIINQLVQATMPNEDIVRGDVYLQDVLQTLNVHLKDVKIFSDLAMKDKALQSAKRCKEILELAAVLGQTAKEEGLEPIKSSQLLKVDEIKGRPVFTIRE